jgi:cytochrome P450
MLNDYWGPSLDTTIFGTASAVWLFAQHPDQWDLLRDDPSLLPHAVNEVLRLESPISQFSRVTTREVTYGEVSVPAGARVLVMYGSANRDERKWSDPERLDVLRKPSDHIGFGYGEHACAGQPLARMEMKAVLAALVQRVERFEVVRMERAMNNMLRGIRTLEVRVRPSTGAGSAA